MSEGRWVPAGSRDDKPRAQEPARRDWRVASSPPFKSGRGGADHPTGEAAGDAATPNDEGADE